VDIAVFSSAEEVELLVNGISVGRKKAGEALIQDMPLTFLFLAQYQPGTVEAVSYTAGKEVSRTVLATTGKPVAIRLTAETEEMKADGESLCYVNAELIDENGNVVPDADRLLKAEVTGAAELLGFGSGNPITDENYSKGWFTSYQGKALAVLRSGYEAGEAKLTVSAEGLEKAEITLLLEEEK
jgi:beta-galactosidase